jgi:hypothetical protein
MAGTGYDKILPHQKERIDEIREYQKK